MGLLKSLLRIDADRRDAMRTLRAEALQRRLRIEELSAEARRKRDEIKMLEDGLARLLEDMTRVEQEIFDLEKKREEHERDADRRKADSVKGSFASDREAGTRVAEDFRGLRSQFHAERERLLSQADTGRMMDNFFQIETFLKDNAQPIPDAARKALGKERADLLAKIGPLVAPPPSPDAVFRATVAYAGLGGDAPRAVVALGLPEAKEETGPADLSSTLAYGAYAAAVEKLGASAPRPQRDGDTLRFEMPCTGHAPEETALELFLAVEEGIKKAAAAAAVRCELTGVFVEPEIAAAVFGAGAARGDGR